MRAPNEVVVCTMDQALGILIYLYANVQYNALLDLASADNSIYSSAWHGPAHASTTSAVIS